jgi:glc operon protein GlcG
MLTLDVASRVLEASLAKAREMNRPVSIVVVDAGGHVVTSARMDGARFLTFEIAYGKAHGCVGFHRTGEEVMKFGQASPGFVSALAVAAEGRFFPALGSIRILSGNEEMGAVGVSGGSGEEDHEIAQAGVAAA